MITWQDAVPANNWLFVTRMIGNFVKHKCIMIIVVDLGPSTYVESSVPRIHIMHVPMTISRRDANLLKMRRSYTNTDWRLRIGMMCYIADILCSPYIMNDMLAALFTRQNWLYTKSKDGFKALKKLYYRSEFSTCWLGCLFSYFAKREFLF